MLINSRVFLMLLIIRFYSVKQAAVVDNGDESTKILKDPKLLNFSFIQKY